MRLIHFSAFTPALLQTLAALPGNYKGNKRFIEMIHLEPLQDCISHTTLPPLGCYYDCGAVAQLQTKSFSQIREDQRPGISTVSPATPISILHR